MDWSPISWQNYQYEQAVIYPDQRLLINAVNELSQLPPLVTRGEINRLKKAIGAAGRGDAFILQGGDCAESFADCRPEMITSKLKILLQMSLVLLHGLRKPIVRIGRIAGQYAKPRSSQIETINGISLPSYRGDLINLPHFDCASRTPNPDFLLKGYSCAAMTLNYIRALLSGGLGNLHHPHSWDISFMEHSNQAEEYRSIVDSIIQSLDCLESIEGIRLNSIDDVNFYASHEALHLHYEQALTRQLSDGKWYDLSTHLPWVGLRTAQTDSAHIEFVRGISNPIGIKIGPSTKIDCLQELLCLLNPMGEEGRVLLISRFGANTIHKLLPKFIKTVQGTGIPVTWLCDPMHGNTEITRDGIKTRHFDNILNELKLALRIHADMGSFLGGVHFELTGENVTECIGGARGLGVADLNHAYHSLVDPRLNYEQSLEMSIQLSREFAHSLEE